VSDLEINDIACLSARISFPRIGRWTADLMVDTEEEITGAARIVSGDGALDLTGTVQHGGVYAAYASVRVVGGAGGLDQEVTPVYYSSSPLRVPLTALLAATGERLSPRSDSAILSRFVPAWVRTRSLGGALLASLMDVAGADWRVLDDGTIWVGTDTYPDVVVDPVEVDTLHTNPSEDHTILTGTPIPPVRPGMTFEGHRVAYVEYHLGENVPAGAELDVWYERDNATTDRVRSALSALIRHETRGTDYHKLFLARVLSQSGNKVDVSPDSGRLPTLSGVPLFGFAPGIEATVTPGSKVLVAFSDGDPSKPVALPAWESGSTIGVPVKRCGVLSGTAPSSGGPVTFTYVDPDGATHSGPLVELSGKITSL